MMVIVSGDIVKGSHRRGNIGLNKHNTFIATELRTWPKHS